MLVIFDLAVVAAGDVLVAIIVVAVIRYLLSSFFSM